MARRVVVLVVVILLGLMATILGIAGSTKGVDGSKAILSDDGTYCTYPTPPSLGLGVVASLFILAAQITGNVAAGSCICCCRPTVPGGSRRCGAIVCLVFSWLLTVISFWLLMVGGAISSSSVHWAVVDIYYCYYPNVSRILISGAVVALLATIFLACFYSLATASAGHGQHLGPAQPQFGVQSVEMGAAQQQHQYVAGYPPKPPPHGYA